MFLVPKKDVRILKITLITCGVWSLLSVIILYFNYNIKGMRHHFATKYDMEETEQNFLGEMGAAVVLSKNLSVEEQQLIAQGWQNNVFNEYVSDLISFHRTLPDARDDWCKEPNRFLTVLPKTSIIICFYNEAWSTLIRTIHSVLDRSPEDLIEEIILVDDFSDLEQLKEPLAKYWKNEPKVKIVRTKRREGLIRARMLGTIYAKAKVLTFMDSHCECNVGWLEPLLDRVARNPMTVVCPTIDPINGSTLEYTINRYNWVAGWNWNLFFWFVKQSKREKIKHSHPVEPYQSPAMAGGLFSINKEYFDILGMYDPGFDIWGAENLELSFKIWMCGGTLEIIPCSHVGHIYRGHEPYEVSKSALSRNQIRLAEVWMDDYKKYYYQRTGNKPINYGDVSGRKELRRRLGCRSFKWYLENIYPELHIPADVVAEGEIRNMAYGGKICLEAMSEKVSMYYCHKMGGNQFFLYSAIGEIYRDYSCLDFTGDSVLFYICHHQKGNQFWNYDQISQHFVHPVSQKCLTGRKNSVGVGFLVAVEECDEIKIEQRWALANYNNSKINDKIR